MGRNRTRNAERLRLVSAVHILAAEETVRGPGGNYCCLFPGTLTYGNPHACRIHGRLKVWWFI